LDLLDKIIPPKIKEKNGIFEDQFGFAEDKRLERQIQRRNQNFEGIKG